MELSVQEKKDIKTKIETTFDNDQYAELYKIIKEDTDRYSENHNGIFVNLNSLNDITLSKIQKFVNFSIENKKTLDEQEELYKKEKENLSEDTMSVNQFYEKKFEESLDRMDSMMFENVYKKHLGREEANDFSSDSEDESRISLKNKKTKFTGVKAKLLKRYRDSGKSTAQNHVAEEATYD